MSEKAGSVKVIHGANDDVFDGLAGAAVGTVQRSLADAFNIPATASSFVNGSPVGPKFRLLAGDVLEFIVVHGHKGRNALFTREQIGQEYHLPPEVLEELLEAIAPAYVGKNGQVFYLESDIDDWMKQFKTSRSALPSPCSDERFWTTRDVERRLACSYSEARERMLDGRIKAIKDGRWLRTRREWVEEYVAKKMVKVQGRDHLGPATPAPPRKRKSNVKLKPGGAGQRFLDKLSD